jgi:preprotein translocase subunit SecD
VSGAEQLITSALREIADGAPVARPMAETAWRAGRRRRTARFTAAAATGAAAITAAVVIPLTGGPSAPAPGGSTPAAGVVILRSPVQFGQIAAFRAGRCPAGSHGLPAYTPLPSCVQLNGARMNVTTVRSVQVVAIPPPVGGYAVSLRLTAGDAARFAALSRRLAGQPVPRCQLAVIVRGWVVAQPTVDGPITGGQVQITGFTRDQAERLVQLLRGS